MPHVRHFAAAAIVAAAAFSLAACGNSVSDEEEAAERATAAAEATASAASTAGSTGGTAAATSGTNSPASTTPSAATATKPAAVATAVASLPAVQKVSANKATRAELTAAFEAAGIPNAATWAKEIEEYRPYPTNDPNMAKLRQNLAKYNPATGVVDKIIATLVLD